MSESASRLIHGALRYDIDISYAAVDADAIALMAIHCRHCHAEMLFVTLHYADDMVVAACYAADRDAVRCLLIRWLRH